MSTQRKDIYSAMPDSPAFGGFGAIEREREIVLSPKRSENPPKRKRKPKKEKYLEEKSAEQELMLEKSLERVLVKRFNALDDDVLDTLFPDGDEKAIDEFVSQLDEKWLLEGVTAIVRRALRGRRRRRKSESGEEDMPSDVEMKSKFPNPCQPGYEMVGMKMKNGRRVPNCVPLPKGKSAYRAQETKASKKPRLRDPKGGLTAAGRAHFKRTEGANLKPGVKGAADTPEKMRRKGSFLTRFFTNPSGPMVGENGKPTRLALSAAAWGEPVPKNRSDAAKLAAKGRRLLERYENTKKKKK